MAIFHFYENTLGMMKMNTIWRSDVIAHLFSKGKWIKVPFRDDSCMSAMPNEVRLTSQFIFKKDGWITLFWNISNSVWFACLQKINLFVFL